MICYGYDVYLLSRDTSKHGSPINRIDQIHPIVESIFCGLPLDKSRLELREMILNDKRFVLTDTTFNNFPPPTFFKGLTTDKGLIEATSYSKAYTSSLR